MWSGRTSAKTQDRSRVHQNKPYTENWFIRLITGRRINALLCVCVLFYVVRPSVRARVWRCGLPEVSECSQDNVWTNVSLLTAAPSFSIYVSMDCVSEALTMNDGINQARISWLKYYLFVIIGINSVWFQSIFKSRSFKKGTELKFDLGFKQERNHCVPRKYCKMSSYSLFILCPFRSSEQTSPASFYKHYQEVLSRLWEAAEKSAWQRTLLFLPKHYHLSFKPLCWKHTHTQSASLSEMMA